MTPRRRHKTDFNSSMRPRMLSLAMLKTMKQLLQNLKLPKRKSRDKDALTAVLARHVIAGSKILSGDLPQGITTAQTLGGEEVEVLRKWSSVSIKSAAGSARVIKADVGATNGVIHVVDTVF